MIVQRFCQKWRIICKVDLPTSSWERKVTVWNVQACGGRELEIDGTCQLDQVGT